MNNFHKNFNIAMLGGFVGLVIMTIAGPKMINMLVTAPVTFGVTCEPATAYSIQKLIVAQAGGIVIGMLITMFIRYKLLAGRAAPVAKNV